MKLIVRWTVLLLVGFTALFSLYGVYVYKREIDLFDRDARKDLLRIARLLEVQLARQPLGAKPDELAKLLGQLDAALPGIELRSLSLAAQRTSLSPRERSALAAKKTVWRSDRHQASAGRTMLFLPVGAGTVVTMAQANTAKLRYTRKTLLAILVATLGVLAVSIVLAFVLSKQLVGAPIAELVHQFALIGRGELTPMVVRRRDELGSLGHAVNAMSSALARHQAEMRRETEARIAAVEQARQADRLATVGRLAAGVAHELGTPLNVVSGLATGIARGEYEPAEIPETAETIAAQGRRMTRIVKDVLHFVRRHQGRAQRADLREIAQGALALLDPMARKAQVVFELEPGGPVFAEVDDEHLTQVVVNLLQNAVQAQPSGGRVEVSVATALARPPDAAEAEPTRWQRLTVRDHGHGMSAEVREQIFDPFFTTKGVGEGTGLGLSVVHGIVHEHGGWIGVESAPGEGSTFSIYLPAAEA